MAASAPFAFPRRTPARRAAFSVTTDAAAVGATNKALMMVQPPSGSEDFYREIWLMHPGVTAAATAWELGLYRVTGYNAGVALASGVVALDERDDTWAGLASINCNTLSGARVGGARARVPVVTQTAMAGFTPICLYSHNGDPEEIRIKSGDSLMFEANLVPPTALVSTFTSGPIIFASFYEMLSAA